MSSNSFRGSVQYKGVSVDYDKGSPAEYDQWLSDDNATDNWEDWGAREKAMETAKAKYEKQQADKAAKAAQEARIAKLESQLAQQKKKSAPKPKGPLAIDPVEHSPEMNAAQQVVDNYQQGLKDQKSPYEQATETRNRIGAGTQNQTDFTAQFNPSGTDDTQQFSPEVEGIKERAQSFADKYKLDLIASGATK